MCACVTELFARVAQGKRPALYSHPPEAGRCLALSVVPERTSNIRPVKTDVSQHVIAPAEKLLCCNLAPPAAIIVGNPCKQCAYGLRRKGCKSTGADRGGR